MPASERRLAPPPAHPKQQPPTPNTHHPAPPDLQNHPRHHWEYWLGDGVYEVVQRMLVPFRKQRIPGPGRARYFPLTQFELWANKKLAYVRGRVEHVNAMVVNHDMFEGRPYRGMLDYLYVYVAITVHLTALVIRLEPTRQLPGWSLNANGHPHYE